MAKPRLVFVQGKERDDRDWGGWTSRRKGAISSSEESSRGVGRIGLVLGGLFGGGGDRECWRCWVLVVVVKWGCCWLGKGEEE